jgi:hypothetical protein
MNIKVKCKTCGYEPQTARVMDQDGNVTMYVTLDCPHKCASKGKFEEIYDESGFSSGVGIRREHGQRESKRCVFGDCGSNGYRDDFKRVVVR